MACDPGLAALTASAMLTAVIVVMFTRAGVSRGGNSSQASSSSRHSAPVSAATGYLWKTEMYWLALAAANEWNDAALSATAVFVA
jgi:hypothetical protein